MWRVLVCVLFAAAGMADGADVPSAEANLRRVEALVAAGAAPRAALHAAERELQNARDEELLRRTLYSSNIALESVAEMLRAASGIRDRAAAALAAQEELVAEGIAAAQTLDKPRQELAYAERQWELTRSRARLVEELAEMARREAELAERRNQELAQRFEGKGTLTEAEFLYVEKQFFAEHGRELPVSARGATALHRSLGFDHRERYDVALNPDQEEGRWLLRTLDRLRIPYIAYRGAVEGKSTGAHIHVGLPSPRVEPAGLGGSH
jgi:hypothetical protein